MNINLPSNPITKGLNDAIVGLTLSNLVKNQLPNFEVVETSGGRSQKEQDTLKDEGYKTAKDSAHLHYLAKDFTLRNISSGNLVSDGQLKTIYNDFIKEFWPGYSEFSPAIDGLKSAHVHVNLPRELSESTKFIGWAAIGFVTVLGVKRLIGRLKA